MNHECFDLVKERRVGMWKLRRHETINVFWSTQLGLRLKKDNDVGMRKTSLLKLNSIEVSSPSTQYIIFDILDKRLKLGMEHSNHQVRAISAVLTWKECRCDLRPVRIGSHGDKEVPTPIVSIDGQSILQVLLHVASAASEGGR
jgi:hypothetical protein